MLTGILTKPKLTAPSRVFHASISFASYGLAFMLLPEFMRGAEDISTRTKASFLGEFYPNLPKIWYDIFVINCQLSCDV
jgi:hypothetical protein